MACVRIVAEGPNDVKNSMAVRKKIIKKPAGAAPKNKDLAGLIEKACSGLIYISETDAPIELFAAGRADSVTRKTILEKTGHPADTPVEETDLIRFFARLTRVEDWYPGERKADAKRFARLKKILEENLTDLRVFKTGKIRLDIFAVGLDKDGRLMGIKTKAVET